MSMTRFRETFAATRVLLPVIHVLNRDQALDNAEVAFANGAHGIFLIGHEMPSSDLRGIYNQVRGQHLGGWIGLNFLDVAPQELAHHLPVSAGGVWTDYSAFDTGVSDHHRARIIRDRIHSHSPRTLWFAGFAFKGQEQPNDLEGAARTAHDVADALTTSGPGTGQSADIDKIVRIRRAIGDAPLAIASGVTPENVHEYRPYVNAYLVATGISKDFHTLDGQRVRALADALHGTDPIAF